MGSTRTAKRGVETFTPTDQPQLVLTEPAPVQGRVKHRPHKTPRAPGFGHSFPPFLFAQTAVALHPGKRDGQSSAVFNPLFHSPPESYTALNGAI